MDLKMMFNTSGDSTRIDDAARQKIARYLEQRVGGFVCPDHGEQPTVIVSGATLESVSFDVRGCCQKVIHLVRRKLEE